MKSVIFPIDVLKNKRRLLCIRGTNLKQHYQSFPYVASYKRDIETTQKQINDLDFAINLLEIAEEW